MVHKTSKTVAQELGLVKITDKNTHNRLIITQTIRVLIDYICIMQMTRLVVLVCHSVNKRLQMD